MNSVVDWFASIGLAQYAQRFVENDVDLGVLAGLTENDLKELGVSSFGHRRKILAAIGKLRGPVVANAQPSVSAVPVPRDAAERRQLSVMFCDLVDSTALSARLDPEEMGKVIAAYQAACSPIIAEYDGLVAKFMGDGILAYFGYPRAHEDDAERAVRASLEIATAIARLKTSARDHLGVRIGIATGLVVVGELIGEGPAQEQSVVGDAPNLAARLQSLAMPGAVVVAASTRRLVGNVFQFRSLGQHALKGFSEPVEAWAVEGLSNSESRFEATHTQQLTMFVGREAESALLLERLDCAWRGDGQIVLISGEAGIGKSRFAVWLSDHVAQQPHVRMRYQGSPYHRESALYPVIRQLESTADIRAGEAADIKLMKLEGVLGRATQRVAEVAPLFASLLSIPFEGRYPPLSLSPAQQRRMTLAALLEQVQGLARQTPMLLLFEDAHWADATSLELINLAIERIRQLPVLFLITFRPEFEPPWEGLENVTRVDLGRLDQGQVESLVARITGGRALPAEVMKQIVAKTDGVPLFVEELTKTIQESGILVADGDRYLLDGPLPPLAIPSTLQDSLMARLDRLTPLKAIVQAGAAIGREFSYAMLQAVIGQDQDTLVLALTQLEAAGMLFSAGSPPDARYTFKHALVQDAAYESLLRSRRQVLHLRIAEVMRDRFADLSEAQPELVAHHFTLAGMVERAIEWWNKAGDLALRRAAFAEAAAHLRKAIDMADQPHTDARTAMPVAARLRLQIAFGQALLSARGYSVPETAAAFALARDLAEKIEDPAARFPTYYGQWVTSYIRAEIEPMQEMAALFLRDAEQLGDTPEAHLAHRLNGTTCSLQGDYLAALPHFELSLAGFKPERDTDLAFRYGQDVGVAAMTHFLMALWPLGEIDRAEALLNQALPRAQLGGHPPSIALAQFVSWQMAILRGQPIQGVPHARVIVDLAEEHGLQLWICFGSFLKGWANWVAEKDEDGISQMHRGIATCRGQSIGLYLPMFQTYLAEAELQAGRAERALAILDDAISETARTRQHIRAVETALMRAKVLAAMPGTPVSHTESAFLAAIRIAREQRTRSFELCAALGGARFFCSLGRRAEAQTLLAPALLGFSANAKFPEIAEATALLHALEGSHR